MFIVSPAPLPSVSPYFIHLLSAYIGQVDGAFEDDDPRGKEQSKEGKQQKMTRNCHQDHIIEGTEGRLEILTQAVNQTKFQ